jgi:hypothetical protein
VSRLPGEDLRTQVAEATVTEHDDAVRTADRDLTGDLKRCGDWLGEDGNVVWQRVGHGVQVALRHGNLVREGAVMIQNADDRAIRAVGVQALAAGLARPAGAVDLTDHAPANERTGLRDTDELVAEHASESHVALNELEIGLADARAAHTNEHFPLTRVGGWSGLLNRYTIVEHQSAHLGTLSEQTAL